MEEFEKLLQEQLTSIEKLVRFRIHNRQDADDLIQDTCLRATEKFSTLNNKAAFKAWLMRIAQNKCNDYYRKQAKILEIPLDTLSESALTVGRLGLTAQNAVMDTLELLGNQEKQILYLFFFKNMPVADIAIHLSIPVGTVKSRLHYAKIKFKQSYPYKPKGDHIMCKIPECMPKYTIHPTSLPPFSVRWEELQGWMLVPRLGEKLTFGLYDASNSRRTEYIDMEVIGKAEVHGIEGVEIRAVQHDSEDYYRTVKTENAERLFIAQLTDTHCRYLAESHLENGVRKVYTFLDGDAFLNNWGYGEENCGNEVNLAWKGQLRRNGNEITGQMKKEAVDIVGRYTVRINEKEYDTICVMDIQCFNDSVASEQYIDHNGRTVLWRRFNKNDWAFHRFGRLWTELLPKNETITINGETYVHWYDCISDYIF